MKPDLRKQAVFGALLKDTSADWKNIVHKEIEENKKLQEKIQYLEENLQKKTPTDILEIDAKRCRNWKYADRNAFELGDIEALAEDMKRNGQLQPAIVRKLIENDYEVIAGERRWRACLLLELPLKAMLTTEDDAGCLVIQTSENKKRSLSPYSRAVAYEKLMCDLSVSQNELSRRLNIPKTSFSELLAFNKVPQVVWDKVEDMTLVKPKTAAFLANICAKGDAYLVAVLSLTTEIREGMGCDNLLKRIEKNLKPSCPKSLPHQYCNEAGEVLFCISNDGKISLAKKQLKTLNLDKLGAYLQQYFAMNQ